MADDYENRVLLEGFFQSSIFDYMVENHMLFGFVGFDGSVNEQAHRDMKDTFGQGSPFENRAEYLRDRIEEMFCLSADEFNSAVEKYNEANGSAVIGDLPVDLLNQVHDAGSQLNQDACTFVADHGQDTAPVIGGGMKP